MFVRDAELFMRQQITEDAVGIGWCGFVGGM